MGDQVIAPPSMPAARPAEFPAWVAEPEPEAASGSSREEAIAEVLRAALAQGHSDEALAGILRKVLAGASPQTALAAPAPDLPNLVVELAEVKGGQERRQRATTRTDRAAQREQVQCAAVDRAGNAGRPLVISRSRLR